jgi:hypothetical protein
MKKLKTPVGEKDRSTLQKNLLEALKNVDLGNVKTESDLEKISDVMAPQLELEAKRLLRKQVRKTLAEKRLRLRRCQQENKPIPQGLISSILEYTVYQDQNYPDDFVFLT